MQWDLVVVYQLQYVIGITTMKCNYCIIKINPCYVIFIRLSFLFIPLGTVKGTVENFVVIVSP